MVGENAVGNPRNRTSPFGSEPVDGGIDFRVWAPAANDVRVVAEAFGEIPLSPEGDGWFGDVVPGLETGCRYGFRVNGKGPFPDPASRFQPDGPHGLSEVIDLHFDWSDSSWTGLTPSQQVLYEIHVGTFTEAGTWAAAEEHLAALKELGITAMEIMPVADFPGRFGWGYDGVNLFAPTNLYGRPYDFRHFINTAHAIGLGVILDVVYNHFGPDGNYLAAFSADFVTNRNTTQWGQSINFDGPGCGPVREFFIANARMWIQEYHLDGLRFDATHAIFDQSHPHILAEIATQCRKAAGHRSILLTAENEAQRVKLIQEHGLDAIWNDDFHHTAMVAATGRAQSYYSDYGGRAQELVSCARHGFLYQGQYATWRHQDWGTPTRNLPGWQLVAYLQNHDQVANSTQGLRLHQMTDWGRYRALTALLLLQPATPLLFQGQDFAASAPFLYFADHKAELGAAISSGRRAFLEQFPSATDSRVNLADSCAFTTFSECVIDHYERIRNFVIVALHQDLLTLRRSLPPAMDGAVLGDEALLLRWFGHQNNDFLLLLNLGPDLHLSPMPEPLLAPPPGRRWNLVFSSESPDYGGGGTPPVEHGGIWSLPGHSALVFTADLFDDQIVLH